MARYDLAQLKHLAIGRWPDLLGLSRELLDNRKEQPCPKCGGSTRFRVLNDFSQTGAMFCSHCFSRDNGDGIAAYAWLHDCTFAQAIQQLAEKLDLKPISQGKKQPGKDAKTRPPAESQFKLRPMVDSIAAIFAARKGGIKAAALSAVGAQIGNHFGANVIALPIRSATGATIGFTAANSTGGRITISYPDGESETTSWKNVIDAKQKGIIGTAGLFTPQGRAACTRVYKTEGPSDLLALIAFLQPGEEAFCNPCGAGENPINFPWLLEWLAGKSVVVVHDRDKAGVDGAMGDPARARLGWATWAAQAAEVRNVELPFPLVDSHGADFRQWVMEGGTAEQWAELVAAAEVIECVEMQVIEDGADPHYLARRNLQNYQSKHARKLVIYKGEWYRWKSGCYVKIDSEELKSKINGATRAEFERQWRQDYDAYLEKTQHPNYDPETDKGPPKIKKVTPQLVSAVVSATASMVQLPGTLPMPCWLPDRSPRNYVSMENGILDFDKVFAGADISDFLLPHSPNWFSEFQLKYKFDWESRCPMWLDYLDYSMQGDQERIAILQEWAGYLLTSTNYLQKFIVLEGKGSNGKTVYFAAMRAMLGNENVSSVPLEKFGGQFDLSLTVGRAANISGDVDEISSVAEGTLKQFTGGDAMTFDRKNRPPLEAIPTAKLMMAWNLRPHFRDRSSGVWRRMILVPFNREVPEKKKIARMDSFQWWLDSGEVPAILRWAIEGLDRLQTMGRFTHSKLCEAASKEYRRDSNPAGDFLAEHVREATTDHRISCQWLYSLYSTWCKETGHRYPLSRSHFGKEVSRAFAESERKMLRPRDNETASDDDRDRIWFYVGIDFSVDKICGKYVYGEEISE